jgi:pimeloyl-ACP methyl ester carboxylesterase
VTGGYAEINGAKVYYEVAGSGRPVVFIHGFSLDARMWDAQFPVFAARYQAVRYDVRGFGRSSVPDSAPYTTEGDLADLLEQLALEKPIVVGQSMGGGIAIDYAVAYPNALSALVVVDAVLGGFQWSDETAASLEAVYEDARASGVEAARKTWMAHGIFAPGLVNEHCRDSLRGIIMDYSGWHWANSEKDPNMQLQPPALERLHEISVPTLVVAGNLDVPDFLRVSDLLEANIPDASGTRLASAGHMSNMEAPEQFNRVVLDFLEGL